MAVVRLDLAYDGTEFRGWARQVGHRTVEGELRRVLDEVCGHSVKLSVAGRTDAGVHARQQVVSFPTDRDPSALQRALNSWLEPEVVVWNARRVSDGFDARYSATAREYRYRISTGPLADPFQGRYEWHRPGELSLPAMRAAARHLLGTHDFSSLAKDDPKRTPVRTVQRCSVSKAGEQITVTVRADAFLRQMVRSMVGLLVEVGSGRADPAAVPAALTAQDRAPVQPAPGHGLTLERVIYG